METVSYLTFLAYFAGSMAFAAILAFGLSWISTNFPRKLAAANFSLLTGGAIAGLAWAQQMSWAFSAYPAMVGLMGIGFAFAPNQRKLRWAAFGAATAAFLFCMQSALEPNDHFVETNANQDAELEVKACQYKEQTPTPFVTDLGRPIRVARFYGVPPTPLALAKAHLKTLSFNGLRDHVLRVSDDWLPANCHGFVFVSGDYRILGEDVERILEDNQYRPVGMPRVGDLVVYRDFVGDISHTGVVRAVDPKRVYVESKWGRLGVFLHPHDLTPYVGHETIFYRADRRDGHALIRRDLAVFAE